MTQTLAENTAATPIGCPTCKATILPDVPGPVRCPVCVWRGEAYFFTPKAVEARPAETALTDDATCIHHPRKKAVAVCAGTGDYICSLCAVEIDGKTYSAEYLNAGGKEKASKAFDRTLPRPDAQIILYLILHFVPYVNAAVVAFAFIWIPHAWILYARALRLRRENEVFARLMGAARVVVLPVLLALYSLAWLAGATWATFAILHEVSR